MRRRTWLRSLAACAAATGLPVAAQPVREGRVLRFPRDDGAHLESAIEWWYATGWSGTFDAPTLGFQLTFFRARVTLGEDAPGGRFAPQQLLFAHAALTDLRTRRHRHDQRIARWNGQPGALPSHASEAGLAVRLGRWTLVDDGTQMRASLPAQGFALDLTLARTQPRLLQGRDGFSRKGPRPALASHYVTEPQLRAGGTVTLDDAGTRVPIDGRAWLDHEWSDALLDDAAVGWDWVGINLADGSALTAFRLRDAQGRATWAGGSWRPAGGTATDFAPADVTFTPGRRWTSPATRADYPVEWTLATPAGRFTVRALLDAQELDSRRSTGAVYWEGLCELLDAGDRRVGLGYLEMTGYAERLRL